MSMALTPTPRTLTLSMPRRAPAGSERRRAAPPDRARARPAELGLDPLAAGGRGRLLAAGLPRAVRAVDVVIPGDSRDQPVILAEVPAHPLGEELLPTVPVLRHGGIRVL